MVKLTDNESKVMLSLKHNHYGDGECTWSWAVDESSKPSGLPKASMGGVIASLQSKGLVSVEGSGNDSAIWVTAAGKAAMQQLEQEEDR